MISRAGVVPEGLGVGEASCLGTISMGIYKAGPSCLKADLLLTQVFFLLFKRICSRNFLCYFKSIQSSTCHQFFKVIPETGYIINWGDFKSRCGS